MKKLLVILLLSSPVFAGECFETIKWKNIPMKEFVTTGATGSCSKFKTGDSDNYKGYFSAVPDSGSGHLARRIWISTEPLGSPLPQTLFYKGELHNICEVSGVEIKLSWAQGATPATFNICRLEKDTKYFLNYSQNKFGTGPAPTASARLVRGASAVGKANNQ